MKAGFQSVRWRVPSVLAMQMFGKVSESYVILHALTIAN